MEYRTMADLVAKRRKQHPELCLLCDRRTDDPCDTCKEIDKKMEAIWSEYYP